MEKVVAIIQARMSSRRLPCKVALDIYGQPLLERVIRQVQRSRLVNALVVATSTEQEDDIVELISRRLEVRCFRGALHDVRSRFVAVGKQEAASIIVRVTADNPLTEPYYMDRLIAYTTQHSDVDYCIMNKSSVPDGTLSEVFRFRALLHTVALDASDYSKEHVTPGIIKSYTVHTLEPEEAYTLNDFFVGVDTFEEYLRMCNIFAKYNNNSQLLKQLIADVKRERQNQKGAQHD